MEMSAGFTLSLLYTGCILVMCSMAKKQGELLVTTEFTPEDCWETADVGDEVTVHYTGTLESGTVFDTSRQPNRGPLPFKLGEGKVIPGWEKGITGMCVGERRKLIIPSQLAYGKKGFPPQIPPDATLIFDTELVSLKKKAVEEMFFRILRFLAVPVGVIVSIYYLYDKYKKAPTKKDLKVKDEKRGKKKRM